MAVTAGSIAEDLNAVKDVGLGQIAGLINEVDQTFLWVAEAGYSSRPPQWK